MRDMLKFDEVDMTLACTTRVLDMMCNLYEFGGDHKKKKK